MITLSDRFRRYCDEHAAEGEREANDKHDPIKAGSWICSMINRFLTDDSILTEYGAEKSCAEKDSVLNALRVLRSIFKPPREEVDKVSTEKLGRCLIGLSLNIAKMEFAFSEGIIGRSEQIREIGKELAAGILNAYLEQIKIRVVPSKTGYLQSYLKADYLLETMMIEMYLVATHHIYLLQFLLATYSLMET